MLCECAILDEQDHTALVLTSKELDHTHSDTDVSDRVEIQRVIKLLWTFSSMEQVSMTFFRMSIFFVSMLNQCIVYLYEVRE